MNDLKSRFLALGKKLTEKKTSAAPVEDNPAGAPDAAAPAEVQPKRAKGAGLMAALTRKKAPTEKQEPTAAVEKPASEPLSVPNFGGALAASREALSRMMDKTGKKGGGGAHLARRSPVTADIRFAVQPDGQRETVWVLSRDNRATRVGDPLPEETLLVFSNQDFRYATQKTLSYTKALSVALENQGQAVRIANRTTDLKAFYARPLEAMPEYEVIAGVQALDQALAMDSNHPGYPVIAGFLLGHADHTQVVILCHYDDAGDAGKVQVSMNPDSLDFVLTQFASTRRVDLETTPVRVYDGDVFRRAVSGLMPFADEDPMMGVPPAIFYARANRLAIWAAACSVAAATFYYTKVDYAESVAQKATAEAQDVANKKEDLIAHSPTSLGAKLALDGVAALGYAQALYRPGLSVLLDTAPGGKAITISVAARLSADMPAEQRSQLLRDIKDLPTPSGCKKNEYTLSSTLNEAKVLYQCDSKTSDFEQYRVR